MKTKTELTIYKAFKKIVGAYIVSSIAVFLGNVVDSLVISRTFSTAETAGFGFIQPVILIFGAIATIFSTGTQAITGRLFGKGDVSGVNATFSLSVAVSFVMGVVFTAVCLIFGENIAALFGVPAESLDAALAYLRGYAPGIAFLLSAPVTAILLQTDGSLSLSYVSVCTMTGINIILDLLVAFFAKDTLGMFGMGLATSIGNAISFAVMLLHFRKPKRIVSLSFRKIKLSRILSIVKTGFPPANQEICMVVSTAIINLIILSLPDGGTNGVAAFAIQSSISPVVCAVINGFGAAILMISSFVVGEDDKTALKSFLGKAVKLGLLVSALMCVLVFFSSGIIAKSFVSAEYPAQISLLANLLRFYSVSIPFVMLTVMLTNIFQSMGKLVLVNAISIMENAVFFFPVAYVCSRFMGADGVWLSFLLSEVCTQLVVFVVVVISGKHLPRHLVAFLMIPRDFSVPKECRLNLTAHSLAEAADISEKLIAFCESRGIDHKRALYSGLCMEEMAVLALNKAEKPCQVDVYTEIDGKKLTIRMKDDGKPFDPTEQNKLLNPDDLVSNIAIRMFFRLAKDVRYTTAFDLNMLTFTL